MARNDCIGRMIGDSLGHTKEVDLEVSRVEWGDYMRVRVKLDISKPLVRKKKQTIRMIEPMWIKFSYERLPDYYSCCRGIGYGHKDCNHWNNEAESAL